MCMKAVGRIIYVKQAENFYSCVKKEIEKMFYIRIRVLHTTFLLCMMRRAFKKAAQNNFAAFLLAFFLQYSYV